jgi:S1-C subfamily serine protease
VPLIAAPVKQPRTRPDGAALGMRNADTITEINGAKITSANTLLDVLAKLDQLNVVEVDGTRGGKPLGITLRLR